MAAREGARVMILLRILAAVTGGTFGWLWPTG